MPIKVLFLCTANSARSILFAATLNHLGQGRFEAYSAGSQPAGFVNPNALAELQRRGISTEGARSKSWDEYPGSDATTFDLVITVCDSAANESCPVFFGDFIKAHWGLPDPASLKCPTWPGHPMTAHWSVPDPASATGTPEQIHRAFTNALHVLQQRISLLLALRMEALDRLAAETKLRQISESPAAV